MTEIEQLFKDLQDRTTEAANATHAAQQVGNKLLRLFEQSSFLPMDVSDNMRIARMAMDDTQYILTDADFKMSEVLGAVNKTARIYKTAKTLDEVDQITNASKVAKDLANVMVDQCVEQKIK